MARYIATQPIYFGTALAFAAGQQVPEDHVERFGYLDAGWVQQVADDHRGDAPDLVPALPDNTPPPMATAARFEDRARLQVEQAQRDFAAAQVAVPPPDWIETDAATPGGRPALIGENGDEIVAPLGAIQPPVETVTPSRTPKAKPGTGDTTNPVKEV